MKSITLLSLTLALLCFVAVNCQNNSKSVQTPTNNVKTSSLQQKAEEVLTRSKDLLTSLPEDLDVYHLKSIFYETVITPATYNGKEWSFTPPANGFVILILLPESQKDFDTACGQAVVMGTQQAKVGGREIIFVVINPKWLDLATKEIDKDYLASVALHESIHVYQFMLSQQTKVELAPEVKEKGAYLFQFQFIPIILERNGIKDAEAPAGRLRINSRQDMVDAAAVVDQSNGGRLGMMSNLVLQEAYFEKCLPLLTLPDRGK